MSLWDDIEEKKDTLVQSLSDAMDDWKDRLYRLDDDVVFIMNELEDIDSELSHSEILTRVYNALEKLRELRSKLY